jgi:ribosome-binding factor A
MSNLKIERINSSIQREISYILLNEVKDSNIKFVTVTAVKTTNDLGHAKIYVTTLKEDQKKETMNALRNAKGFIRTELANRIDIRHIPALEFIYDESIEYGKRIENKIKEIHEN